MSNKTRIYLLFGLSFTSGALLITGILDKSILIVASGIASLLISIYYAKTIAGGLNA